MLSNSQDLLELIIDTKKYLNHLRHLGVEIAGTAAPATVLQTSSKPTRPKVELPKNLQVLPETSAAVQPAASPVLPREGLFGKLAPAPERICPSTESFEDIQLEIGDCVRCPLHQRRTHVVHTEGNRKARLMFVGEAPGADEDIQARPFVGRAGQLLTKIIEAIGLKREEVLIGNVNRCRPPGNRPPTPEEATTCKPFLIREIAIVQPEVIVVLGNTAMRNLLDTKETIGRLRGCFQDYKGIKVMPTFHPAYLLRDPSKKRETWDDLKKVRDYLESTRKNV